MALICVLGLKAQQDQLLKEKNKRDIRSSSDDLPVPINDQVDSESELKKKSFASLLQNEDNMKEEKKFWLQVG